MSEDALVLKNVHHQYGKSNKSGAQLRIPQWHVEKGDNVFLYGDSGSGKSTLLNLLSGVLKPNSGSIEILGQDLCTMSNTQRDAFRARHIGVVFQTFNLIPYLSVLKNIELAAYFAKNDVHAVKEHAQQLLSSLHLPDDILSKPVNQMSIGQQQRVAIVRALINYPEILLVDEPTSALDASARDAFMRVLLEITKETHTTLIFVSHDKALASFFKTQTNIRELVEAGEVA